MIIHVKFIGVRGKKENAETLRKALYGHTDVYAYCDNDEEFVALLRTEGPEESSVNFWQQSQADRLRSFVCFQVKQFDTPKEADESEHFGPISHMRVHG